MKTGFDFARWFKGRKVQRFLVIFTFMAVPLLLLFVFTYLPFGEMVNFSFYKKQIKIDKTRGFAKI